MRWIVEVCGYSMFESHVNPVAIVLETNPSRAPETQQQAHLREHDGVMCLLRPVTSLNIRSVEDNKVIA